ncbi:hypothetical protein MMC06_002505 [Schaereria dolodes]|nr:hypothetical protein [Schaereria dolodes]
MTLISPTRRPLFRYAEFSSSSLSRLEQIRPKQAPLHGIVQDYSCFLNKPLPSRPKQRKSSSIYSTQNEDIVDLYTYERSGDNLLPSHFVLVPTKYTTAATDKSRSDIFRSTLRRDDQPYSSSEHTLAQKRSRNSVQGVKRVYPEREAYQSSDWSHLSAFRHAPSHIPKGKKVLDMQAEPYMIGPLSPSLQPADLQTVQYSNEYHYPENQLSSRITDIVDHSLVPQPLRFSGISESKRTLSQSPPTSPYTDSAHDGVRKSLRLHVRKAFRLTRTTPEEKERKRVMSVASMKYPHMSFPSDSRRGRISSIASQRRASIQNGLSNMYDTLTNLSIGSWKTKDTKVTSPSQNAHIPREHRSPAIPMTPYQHLGTKAWELPQLFPKPQWHRRSQLTFLSKRRREKMWRGPDNPDSETSQSKRTSSERRREALKESIVLVGTADQYPDGRVNHWT